MIFGKINFEFVLFYYLFFDKFCGNYPLYCDIFLLYWDVNISQNNNEVKEMDQMNSQNKLTELDRIAENVIQKEWIDTVKSGRVEKDEAPSTEEFLYWLVRSLLKKGGDEA